MGWPQITWIALVGAGVGVSIAKHGQERDAYNMWWALVGTGLSAFLLAKGGFFG